MVLSSLRRRCIRSWAVAVCIVVAHIVLDADGREMPNAPPVDGYRVDVTHVDISKFPRIRVYVAISDAKGNQLDDGLPVMLRVTENGRLVAEDPLSSGHPVSAVLVLDASSSMTGDKLRSAKDVAIGFVESAPPSFQIATIRFATDRAVASPFGASRESQCERIESLVAEGSTALQDGIGLAFDILRGRVGRKVVLVLTDGLENSSCEYAIGDPGLVRLLGRAKIEGCSVFTIGLGQNVDESYLRRFESTGGTYLFSPTPGELPGVFASVLRKLEREHIVEYTTAARELDGSVRNVAASLQVGPVRASSESVSFPLFGVVPNIPARLGPYGLVFLVLLVAPPLVSFVRGLAEVRAFRAGSVVRLGGDSRLIGRADLNGKRLERGDVVVLCPLTSCGRAHHVRSWRVNRCRCLAESEGSGHYCYSRLLPAPVRHALYRVNGASTRADGRRWLCWCAGDEKGY